MTWRTMLLPYVKNVQLYQCPSKRQTTTPYDGATADYGKLGGYDMNEIHAGTNSNGSPTPPPGVADASVTDAAATITFTDLDDSGSAYIGYDDNTHNFVRSDGGGKRHNDGANYAYYDGHVKFLALTKSGCGSSGGNDNCPWSIE